MIVHARDRLGTGFRPDATDPRDLTFRKGLFGGFRLPPAVNLYQEMPGPVFDQGDWLGSCTSNAIAKACQWAAYKEGHNTAPPSRLAIYWKGRQREGTLDKDDGLSNRTAIQVVQQGVVSEADWPYDTAKWKDEPPGAPVMDVALEYRRVRRRTSDMKALLARGFPFVAGITLFDNFDALNASTTGKVPLPKKGSTVMFDHDVLICGYNNFTRTWTFLNCWSPNWGAGGYGFLPFGYPEAHGSDFWAIRRVA